MEYPNTVSSNTEEELSITQADPSSESDTSGSSPDAESPSPRLHALLETLSEAAPDVQKDDASALSEPALEIPQSTPQIQAETANTPEDAALIKEMQSDESRAHLQTILDERAHYANDLQQIRGMFEASGISPEELAQTLEFSALLQSGETGSLQTALQMIEAKRADLCKKLGVELPGINALAEYPDLTQEVQQGTITRQRALEIADLRSKQDIIHQHATAQRNAQQEHAQFESAVTQGQQAMMHYLQQNAHTVDHPARLQAIQAYFAQPSNVQSFVQTYHPTQWEPAIKWMYEQIRTAPTHSHSQPLRSSTAPLGRPSNGTYSVPADRLAQRIEGL